jgi:cell wall-associated NlpC family hydrolase
MQRRITAYLATALILAGLLFCALMRPARTMTDAVVMAAGLELGRPYVLGACEPGRAFDCSALIAYAYAAVGIQFQPLAVSIGYNEHFSRVYDIDRLMRGDIVCFDTVVDKDLSDHVGIYLGGGYFLHASSVYEKVVITPLCAYAHLFSWGLNMQSALNP